MLVRPGKNVDVSGMCKFQYLQDWESEWRVRYAFPSPPPKPHIGGSSVSEPHPHEVSSESISPPRPPPKPLSISAPVTHSTITAPSIPTSLDRTISQRSLQSSTLPPQLSVPITGPLSPAASPPSYVGVQPPEAHRPLFPETYPAMQPSLTTYSSASPPPPPPPPQIMAHSSQSSAARSPSSQQLPPVPETKHTLHSHEVHPNSVHYNPPPLSGFRNSASLSQVSVSSPRQQVSMPTPQLSYRVPAPDLMGQDDSDITPSNRNNGDSSTIPPDNSAPVPPRPLNPQILSLHNQLHEKISAELMRVTRALSEDSERLRTTQTHLLNGELAIRDEMARLEAVRDVCRTVAQRTKAFVDEAETRLSDAKKRGEPDIDELVCSTSIVGNQ